MFNYILTDTTFTGVTKNNRTITVHSNNTNWADLMEAIKREDWDMVEVVTDRTTAINKFGEGKVEVVDGVVYFQGKQLHNTITERIMRMIKEGFNVGPMVSFLENLMENPSYRSIQDTYRFMEHNSLPITSDGHFLAYKRVTADFKDSHTGTFDNSVGSTVTMERRDVEDNPDVTCSSGLHFCSIGYLSHFYGDNIVILKISPANVVSIPTDYDNAKGRCCEYEVVGIHQHGTNTDTLSDTSVNDNYDDAYDEGYSDAMRNYDINSW